MEKSGEESLTLPLFSLMGAAAVGWGGGRGVNDSVDKKKANVCVVPTPIIF